jgi:deazaflavin-dependent oxidoreductase (nitroreductase family)
MSSASPARAYRPSRNQRWANAVLAWLLARGRGPAFMRLLTVRGRVTGRQLTTPVVPVQRDGRVWVVSPFGDVAWVRNARATGRVELQRGEEHITYAVRELDAHEAVPVLRRYLTVPSRFFVHRHFDVSAKSPADAITAEAHRHPTFELTPVR